MLHIIMPANVSEFFGLILPVAMFDIIESSYSTELIMDFDYVNESNEAETILGQMRDLGYEQHNAILNLGSLAIFSFLYYVKLIFYIFVLKPMVFFTGRGKRMKRSLRKSLFYSDILALSIEAYIEFLICGYLNQTTPLYTTNGEIVANIVGHYSLVMTLVIIPLVFVYVLKQPIAKINERRFHRKWEGMFEGVRTKSKIDMLFYPIFVLRRLIFCYTAFYMAATPVLQIIACLLCNLAVLIYKGYNTPL